MYPNFKELVEYVNNNRINKLNISKLNSLTEDQMRQLAQAFIKNTSVIGFESRYLEESNITQSSPFMEFIKQKISKNNAEYITTIFPTLARCVTNYTHNWGLTPLVHTTNFFKEAFSWTLGLKFLRRKLQNVGPGEIDVKLPTLALVMAPLPEDQQLLNNDYGFYPAYGIEHYKLCTSYAGLPFVATDYFFRNIGKLVGFCFGLPFALLAGIGGVFKGIHHWVKNKLYVSNLISNWQASKLPFITKLLTDTPIQELIQIKDSLDQAFPEFQTLINQEYKHKLTAPENSTHLDKAAITILMNIYHATQEYQEAFTFLQSIPPTSPGYLLAMQETLEIALHKFQDIQLAKSIAITGRNAANNCSHDSAPCSDCTKYEDDFQGYFGSIFQEDENAIEEATALLQSNTSLSPLATIKHWEQKLQTLLTQLSEDCTYKTYLQEILNEIKTMPIETKANNAIKVQEVLAETYKLAQNPTLGAAQKYAIFATTLDQRTSWGKALGGLMLTFAGCLLIGLCITGFVLSHGASFHLSLWGMKLGKVAIISGLSTVGGAGFFTAIGGIGLANKTHTEELRYKDFSKMQTLAAVVQASPRPI